MPEKPAAPNAVRVSGFLSLLLFCGVAAAVVLGATAPFDRAAYAFLAGLRSPALTEIARTLDLLGGGRAICAICLLLLAVPGTRMRFGLPVAGTVAFSAALNFVVKHAVARPRPDAALRLIQENGFSFPSGHAMNNMALYAMLVLLVWTYTKDEKTRAAATLAACVYVLAMGASRVYLGVHYASDVAGGFALGYAVATGCFVAWKKAASLKVDTL